MNILYWMGKDNKFQCYVTTHEAHKILREFHDKFVSGHFIANIATKKILDFCYLWPALFINVT
jgi:hypothetical protein